MTTAARPEDEDASRADPLDAPSDRFCDIVMEGGVTSGIIYASAVVELGRHYRFKNIGGSSIGAFAAALTAAAEFRRRNGSAQGFEKLAKLPEVLAEEDEGRTTLERLFKPQAGTSRLFGIFIAALERDGPMESLWHGVRAALRAYRRHVRWIALLIALIVLAGPLATALACPGALRQAACYAPLVAALPALLLALGVGAVAGLLLGVARDFANEVPANGFGLCRGWESDKALSKDDLAGFLHLSIQDLAGLDPEKKVLTFRDLWNAPGAPGAALGIASPAAARSINLEVYASNLTHGRPYRFPMEPAEEMGRLFFRMDELDGYFPMPIVRHLVASSQPYTPRSDEDPPQSSVGPGYFELPFEDLPIVVAARLAMSFPGLISSIPLYSVNHGQQRLSRCWISDGGLCSNFPIHLFDSFLPMWPTFGISLHTRAQGASRRVWLPEFHSSGRGDTWDLGTESGSWKLANFLISLWKTTWRWNDMTMMRMPAVRDRSVRIYLEKGEGGVNIRMPAPKIREFGQLYGTPAARAFVRKFAEAGARGWHEHRWVRMNCLLVALRDRMRNFGKAVLMNHHTIPVPEQIAQALQSAPLRHPQNRSQPWPSETTIDPAQAKDLQRLVEALCELEKVFDATGEEPYRALPRPSLRMRHPT